MNRSIKTVLQASFFTVFTLLLLGISILLVGQSQIGYEQPEDSDRELLIETSGDFSLLNLGGTGVHLDEDESEQDGSFVFLSGTVNGKEDASSALYQAMDQVENECSLLAYSVAVADFPTLFSDLLNHSPEFFYVSGVNYTYNSVSQTVVSVKFTYTLLGEAATKEEIKQAKLFYYDQIDTILAEMPQGMSNLDIVLWLHDYLCIHFAYDNDLQSTTTYSFFKSGVGVCQAYTLTYMALLKKCGISVDYVSSDEMNHIWNVVELDGEWYHVDVTWDDAQDKYYQDVPGRALHDNFLCSDSSMEKTGHTNWVGKSCSSDRFQVGFLTSLGTAAAYYEGRWYAVDRLDKKIYSFEMSSLIDENVLSVDGIWYQWGSQSVYYSGCFSNICTLSDKLYYSTPRAICELNPQTGESSVVFTYEGGDGYLYALFAEGDSLVYSVSKSYTNAQATYFFWKPSQSSVEIPPSGGDKQYLNLSSGEDDFSALYSILADRISFLMIGDIQAIEMQPYLTMVISFVLEDNQTISYTLTSKKQDPTLFFFQAVREDSVLYSAADGYCLFGAVVSGVPENSWKSAKISVYGQNESELLYECDLTLPDMPVSESDPSVSKSPVKQPTNPVDEESELSEVENTEEDELPTDVRILETII